MQYLTRPVKKNIPDLDTIRNFRPRLRFVRKIPLSTSVWKICLHLPRKVCYIPGLDARSVSGGNSTTTLLLYEVYTIIHLFLSGSRNH